MEVRLFNYLLGDMAQKKQVVSEKDLVRLTTHKVTLAQDQEDLSRRLEDLVPPGPLLAAHLQGGHRGRPRSPPIKSNSSSRSWSTRAGWSR